MQYKVGDKFRVKKEFTLTDNNHSTFVPKSTIIELVEQSLNHLGYNYSFNFIGEYSSLEKNTMRCFEKEAHFFTTKEKVSNSFELMYIVFQPKEPINPNQRFIDLLEE